MEGWLGESGKRDLNEYDKLSKLKEVFFSIPRIERVDGLYTNYSVEYFQRLVDDISFKEVSKKIIARSKIGQH